MKAVERVWLTLLVSGGAFFLVRQAFAARGEAVLDAAAASCPAVSSISSNFNGTPIAENRFVWFNSVLKVESIPPAGATIFFDASTITFIANGTAYNLAVPGSTITFDPNAFAATTVFDAAGNRWITVVPADIGGNTFLSGLAFPVPSGGFPGGINPVTWQGAFTANGPGLKVKWKWAAAVYTDFNLDANVLGVKPVDDNKASQYQNSDHAGTPENYKRFVTGGARGGGGSNFTGSYSGTAGPNPCVATPTPTPTNTRNRTPTQTPTRTLTNGSTNTPTNTPTPTPPACTTCLLTYPDNSNPPRSQVEFNESEVLRAFDPSACVTSGDGTIKLWYNDEHALTLGVRSVIVKDAGGTTTTTDYPVSPLLTNPGHAVNPATGTNAQNGDQAGTDTSSCAGFPDVCDRPMWPSLFVTDITFDPNDRSGDWQFGGVPNNPNDVFGTWKAAVRTVDKTKSPAAIAVIPDADPAQNDWNLDGGDPAPAGLRNEGYGAEVRWNLSDLHDKFGNPLVPNHLYRLQFMVHDGDQNKVGGDVGEACTSMVVPPGFVTNTPTPTDTMTPTFTPTPTPGGGREICFQCTTFPDVHAHSSWVINGDGSITIHTLLSRNFVDNTYGTNVIGWPNGHSFSNLTGSDELTLALYDNTNTKRIEFQIDYLSASADAPSGYKTLCVSGGDGKMITGSASDVVGCLTSLDANFNTFGYVLATNSPATDANYTPNPTYPNWIFDVWYDVTVKPGPFAAGGGFLKPLITNIHASPSKKGQNTCPMTVVSCPTPTPTATPTSTPTVTPTMTPTATNTPTATATNTPTATATDTPTSTPTSTPTAAATDTPTSTPTEMPVGTFTPTGNPVETPTPTPRPTMPQRPQIQR